MAKVLIISNSLSGLISFRVEVVEAICAAGHDLTVATMDDSGSDRIKAIGAAHRIIKNLSRRGMSPTKDLKLFIELRSLIKELRPDIVLTYTIKPNIYGGMACAVAGIPYLVNITGLGTAVENPGWLQKLTVGMYRIAMRGAFRIFFQNSANQEFFASRAIRNDVHKLIPGSGVNLSHHHYQDYPESDEPIRFLFISRIMHQKGIDEYFAAAKHFKEKHANVEFHILGHCEEDYIERLNELHENGVVIYHGSQKDVRPFIAQSHCLIHPSFYPEGMSNVVLENAAAGRPVITTRRPGCQEAVDDGITGFLITPRDTAGLIDVINRFIHLPHEKKREMGRMGRKKMEKEFDRNIVVKAYMDAIKEILD